MSGGELYSDLYEVTSTWGGEMRGGGINVQSFVWRPTVNGD